jgi:hypothetical protein
MKTDKEMIEILEQNFSMLDDSNRKKIIEMTKFLVFTQNAAVPAFLEEKSSVDMATGTEKVREKTPQLYTAENRRCFLGVLDALSFAQSIQRQTDTEAVEEKANSDIF